MIELRRRVRFSVPLPGATSCQRVGWNTFASWPSMVGLGAFYEIEVACRGEPDDQTGYLLNIAEIDRAVREHAIGVVEAAVRGQPESDPASHLPAIVNVLAPALRGRLASVRWFLHPYYSVAMDVATPNRAVLTERFEFAAAHRLNCRNLSPQENQRLFGKCNNPGGHGHNYHVDVSVAVPVEEDAESRPPARRRAGGPRPPSDGRRFNNLDLERIVFEQVIRRFDHRNLDSDTQEFEAINSSVENIARTCHELLRDPIAEAGGELVRVVVWETEKTGCAYPA